MGAVRRVAADEWDGLHAAVDAVVRRVVPRAARRAARRRGRDAGHLSVTRGEFGFELRVYRRARTPEGAAAPRRPGRTAAACAGARDADARAAPEGTADGELGP